jgi:hypothetical protein
MGADPGLAEIEGADVPVLRARQAILGRGGEARTAGAGLRRALVLVRRAPGPVVAGSLEALALDTAGDRAGIVVFGAELRLAHALPVEAVIVGRAQVTIEAELIRERGMAAHAGKTLIARAFLLVLRAGKPVILRHKQTCSPRTLVLRAFLPVVAEFWPVNEAIAVVVEAVAGFRNRLDRAARR